MAWGQCYAEQQTEFSSAEELFESVKKGADLVIQSRLRQIHLEGGACDVPDGAKLLLGGQGVNGAAKAPYWLTALQADVEPPIESDPLDGLPLLEVFRDVLSQYEMNAIPLGGSVGSIESAALEWRILIGQNQDIASFLMTIPYYFQKKSKRPNEQLKPIAHLSTYIRETWRNVLEYRESQKRVQEATGKAVGGETTLEPSSGPRHA